MEIYVQSRGLDRDYYWVVKKENQREEEIPISPPIIKKANGLIDDEYQSVVILRSQDNKLLLLVAGLATKRKDIKTRAIRNSLALVGENEDEPTLRKIAALALQNELENKINQFVDSSLEGFKVEWENIQNFISVSTAGSEPLSSQEVRAKIALISDDFKHNLAAELLRYELPKKEEVLVIVTKGKSKETLEGAKVWRGLSNDPRISNNWTHIPGSTELTSTKPPTTALLITVLIVISAILIVFVWLQDIGGLINKQNLTYNEPCGGNQEVLTAVVNDLKPQEQQKETVKILQRILTTEKIKVNIDGNFNENTKNAVAEFQNQYNQGKEKAQKIQVNGIVDNATLKALWLETKDNKTQKQQKIEEELWNNGLCKPSKIGDAKANAK